jgi:hypothetical protein
VTLKVVELNCTVAPGVGVGVGGGVGVGDGASLSLNTKASSPPPLVAWAGPVVGKLTDPVGPETYAVPPVSSARASVPSKSLPPRYVE